VRGKGGYEAENGGENKIAKYIFLKEKGWNYTQPI